MGKKDFGHTERSIMQSAFKETNELLLESRDQAKQLYGETETVTGEILESAICRLYDDEYEIDDLSGKEAEKKANYFRRLDAALILRDMVVAFDFLKSHYPEHLLWYHIGVLRSFLILSDARFRPSDLSKKLLKTVSPEAEEIIESALPEIEEIYVAIKRVGFSGTLVGAEEKWKEAALDRFDDSRKGFKLIKREYLEENSLYLFTVGKEKRDFEGGLLKRIVKDQTGEKCGGQPLREIAQSIRSRSKETD
jgi:hypothetical protein